MKYDHAVVIGRFQPFHVGHERVLKFAQQHAKSLIILIGSSDQHRSPRNPFSFNERSMMIKRSIEQRNPNHIPIHDSPYNDNAWVTEVRDSVSSALFKRAGPVNPKIALVGYRKDSSSYYQALFPEWDYIEVPSQYGTFNATDIRKQYFQDSPIISEFLNPGVRDFLKDFAFTDEFKWLLDETKYLDLYRKQWGRLNQKGQLEVGPFVTVDSVCVQAGHILLVTRKEPPFRGALAVPGGFVNPQERIADAVLRELKEETRIQDSKGEIPPAMLRSFITRSKVYDAPDRSARGRIITHAFKFEFPNRKDGLYKVIGDDDAEFARWYSFSELRPEMFMEDHAHIIQDMTGVKL